MRNHIAVKAAAIFLCALMLLAAITSGLSVILMAAMGISETHTVEDAYASEMSWEWRWAAENIVRRYASRELGGFTEAMVDAYYGSEIFSNQFKENSVFYTLLDREGNKLESNYPGVEATVRTMDVFNVVYNEILAGPVFADSQEEAEALLEQQLAETARTAYFASAAVGNGVQKEQAQDQSQEQAAVAEDSWVTMIPSTREGYYRVGEALSPEYTVMLYLTPNAMSQDTAWNLIRIAWNYRNVLMAALGASLLVLALCVVYLCCTAGRGVGSDEIRPGGLNRLPLDLYLLIAGTIITILFLLTVEGTEYLMRQGTTVTVAALGYIGFMCCLLVVGFCYAFVAQIKTPNLYWLKNTVCVRWWHLFVRLCKWCWHLALEILRAVPRILRGILVICWSLVLQVWRVVCRIWANLRKRICRVLGKVHKMYRMLPLTWQWLAAGACMMLVLVIGFCQDRALWALAALGVCAGMILYGANCFGILLKSARRMRGGDLEIKVDDRLLVGAFKDFAQELNGLAGVAVVAAQKQLKSERMKTELITNVSHDIKTPLTSIINYVDLLQREHSPEEEKMYLETLARQSNRMKKLIEDLIEMSKASTGNMPVEITRMNAAEAVQQALGEFSDKLAAANLTPMFQPPEQEFAVYADGRLFWRAMSNILSNAVKYAMPGTRLYVDLSEMNDKVFISVKNVSRDALNVSGDELMERFVRGDSSRNTEGSGLGLNIAKSLMELQHGQLQVLVDGDLFKVTLIFPRGSGE